MRYVLSICYILITFSLSAQQLTRVATIDYMKILMEYEQDSKLVKRYQEEKVKVQERLETLNEEIKDLEEQQRLANEDNQVFQARNLTTRISSKKRYLNSFLRSQVNRLANLQKRILSQNKFSFELEKAIELTARERGISLVVNQANPYLLWSSPDIDLTADVLKRVEKQLPKPVVEPEVKQGEESAQQTTNDQSSPANTLNFPSTNETESTSADSLSSELEDLLD